MGEELLDFLLITKEQMLLLLEQGVRQLFFQSLVLLLFKLCQTDDINYLMDALFMQALSLDCWECFYII